MHFDAGYIGRILAAWIVTCLPTVAEEGWRMVALRVPAKDAAAIRNELSIAKNATTRGAIDAILKRRGVEVVIDRSETGKKAWAPQTEIHPDQPPPENEFGREPIRHVIITPKKTHLGVYISMRVDLEFTNGKASSEVFSGSTDLWLTSGKWQEVLSWQKDDRGVMVWQFGDAGELPAKPEDDDDRELQAKAKYPDNWQVEAKLYKATEADLTQLAKSGEDTRDKAAKWLAGRADSWLECRFPGIPRHVKTVTWQEMKVDTNRGTMAAKDCLVSWVRWFDKDMGDRDGPSPPVKWRAELSSGEKQVKPPPESSKGIIVKNTLGIWHFVPIEGVEEFNLLVCRLTPP